MRKKDLKFKEKIKSKLNELMKQDINGDLLEPIEELGGGKYLIFNEIETDESGLIDFLNILELIIK